MNSQNIAQKIIQEINEIPPLPDVVVRVMRITRDPEASAQELTRVISQDQALTGNILRLCNSAYYGLPRVVSSLTQAVMYLGFHTVRSLVLTCSISNLFSPDKRIYGYGDSGLWKHAIATAMTSELICKKVRPDLSDTVFTAGLLHDMGQLILGIKIADTAETIIDLMVNAGMGELEAEREAVGITHVELGGLLADKWNFPDELVHAIRYHHDPDEAISKSILTSIVHLADSIALTIGFGIELDNIKYPPKEYALKSVDLTQKGFEKLVEDSQAMIEEHAEQLLLAVK